MDMNHLRIGQEVSFGRQDKQRGTIVKLNPKSAKIREIDTGEIWNVSYGLIHDDKPITIPYSPFTKVENLVMEAICEVYSRLSPENLTCDGEIPYGQTTTIRHKLERQLRLLCQTIERTVTEEQAYEWDRQRAAFKKGQQ